ncbi:hypothetical protein OROMI_001572 [Orobanche minor]
MANYAIKSIVLLGMLIISSLFVSSSGARLLLSDQFKTTSVDEHHSPNIMVMRKLGIDDSKMKYYHIRAKTMGGQKRLSPEGPDPHHHVSPASAPEPQKVT